MKAQGNPTAVIPAARKNTQRTPPSGLYVTDTSSHNVFFAPSSQLARYAGDLVIGGETQAIFWIVRPRGRGFQTFQVPVTLPGANLNLEGAAYVSG